MTGRVGEVGLVTLSDIIRAEKTNVSTGVWKTGKIPHASFPLGKAAKGIPVGPCWMWRLCEFEALGLHCRVLVRLNLDYQRYHAVLAVETNGQLRVVCHHDLHPPEKGWHCHFIPGNVLETFPGVMRDRDRMRVWQSEPSKALDQAFTVTRANGLTYAANRYRFRAQGGLL